MVVCTPYRPGRRPVGRRLARRTGWPSARPDAPSTAPVCVRRRPTTCLHAPRPTRGRGSGPPPAGRRSPCDRRAARRTPARPTTRPRPSPPVGRPLPTASPAGPRPTPGGRPSHTGSDHAALWQSEPVRPGPFRSAPSACDRRAAGTAVRGNSRPAGSAAPLGGGQNRPVRGGGGSAAGRRRDVRRRETAGAVEGFGRGGRTGRGSTSRGSRRWSRTAGAQRNARASGPRRYTRRTRRGWPARGAIG